jgi:hypothetical protein
MKREMKYGALFIILSLWVAAIVPSFANLGPDLNSGWASTSSAPIIDGTLEPAHWVNATIVNFQLAMRSRFDGSLVKTLDATLYVENNNNNLYIAVKIFQDTYWATDFANRWKGLAVLFDTNHNGVLEQGENGEGITTYTLSLFYSKNDLYYNAAGGAWDSDVNAGKTNDGAIAFSHTNPTDGAIGDWTFEMRIPLVGSDLGYDFNIPQSQLPKMVGFKVWFLDNTIGSDGVYPDDPAINTNLDETFNAGTFGNLIIHPLYYLTIQTTSGGTTNPAAGVYSYGYGTVVSVTALPSGGYMLSYWTLDTVNVGATNPYSVTMDGNHTLKAWFVLVPPVGGIAISGTAFASSIAVYGMLLAVFGVAVGLIRRKRN